MKQIDGEEREELNTLRLIFNQQKKRERPYIQRWRAAVDQPDMLPDYGKFLEYLLDEVERLQKELKIRVDYAAQARQQALRIHELELEKAALVRGSGI